MVRVFWFFTNCFISIGVYRLHNSTSDITLMFVLLTALIYFGMYLFSSLYCFVVVFASSTGGPREFKYFKLWSRPVLQTTPKAILNAWSTKWGVCYCDHSVPLRCGFCNGCAISSPVGENCYTATVTFSWIIRIITWLDLAWKIEKRKARNNGMWMSAGKKGTPDVFVRNLTFKKTFRWPTGTLISLLCNLSHGKFITISDLIFS